MIIEVKTDEELQAAFEKESAADINVLFTNPKTCAPCRSLDAMIEKQVPTQDVYVCDLSKYRYEHQIMSVLRSIPTLVVLSGKDVRTLSGATMILDKINA